MRELTKEAVERLRSVVETHRIVQDDLISFNVSTLASVLIIFASSYAAFTG
jgi:hypothetical protein